MKPILTIATIVFALQLSAEISYHEDDKARIKFSGETLEECLSHRESAILLLEERKKEVLREYRCIQHYDEGPYVGNITYHKYL